MRGRSLPCDALDDRKQVLTYVVVTSPREFSEYKRQIPGSLVCALDQDQ